MKLTIPLNDDDRKAWESRIKAAETKRDSFADLQRENVDAYKGEILNDAPSTDTVIVPKDFANVEQKKAQLFFQQPDIQATALSVLQGQEDAVTIWQAVLNQYLGPHGVDALTCVDECLFDCLCPAGYAASKIGYTVVQDGEIPIQVGEQPRLDPMTGQPQMDPTSGEPMMDPVTQPGPKIIFEEYFWKRFSPLKVLVPADFYGSDYDQAAWIGMEFVKPFSVAKDEYQLPDDFGGTVTKDKNLLIEDEESTDSSAKFVKGWELWYKASLFDRKEKHPQRLRRLVMIDGHDTPCVHENSPYQKFDPESGRLTGGMVGFPVHVLTLRYLGDSAYPPSDCTVSRNQVQELSETLTTMLLQRKRAVPMRFADLGRIGGEDGLSKLQKNIWQAVIPLESYDKDNPPVAEMAMAAYPRDNYQIADAIERDISEAWAMGANQRGNETDTTRTATELNLIQKNTDTRLDKERARVLLWYIKGVEKLASLIQMFADEQDYVQIVGQGGVQRLAVWDKNTVQGKFAYALRPDSSIKIDAASDRKQALEFVNYSAKSPFINQQELMTWVTKKFNLDPAKLITKPPESGPPPPNVSFRFSGEDFIGPQAPMVMQIIQQAGYKITYQIGQDLNPESEDNQVAGNGNQPLRNPVTPGSAPKAEVVSKGGTDRSHSKGGTA